MYMFVFVCVPRAFDGVTIGTETTRIVWQVSHFSSVDNLETLALSHSRLDSSGSTLGMIRTAYKDGRRNL